MSETEEAREARERRLAEALGALGRKAELDLSHDGRKSSRGDLIVARIGDAGARRLADALAAAPAVLTVDLRGNAIGDEGAFALVKALAEHGAQRTLNLLGNAVGLEAANRLVTQGGEAVRVIVAPTMGLDEALPAIRENVACGIDLSGQAIGDEGAAALGDALKVNTSVRFLVLSRCEIGDKGAVALGTALETNTSLQNLNLQDNKIGDEGGVALGTALAANTVLRSLNLEKNKIGGKGGVALGTALETNTSLQNLNLQNNQIGNEGGVALGTALATNTTLQSLNLAYNKIGNEGGVTLGTALAANTSLQSLNLELNRIGKEGGVALGKGLVTNTSLQNLNLYRNEIGDEGGGALGTGLAANMALQSLNLKSNKIGGKGGVALGTALATNTTLQSLNLAHNKIGDEGGVALGTGIATTMTLQNLILRNNNMVAVLETHLSDTLISPTYRSLLGRAAFYLSREQDHGDAPSPPARGALRWGDNACTMWDLARLKYVSGVASVLQQTISAQDADADTKRAIKALVESTHPHFDAKATLLHLACSSSTAAALDLCQLLVDTCGVDFDALRDGAGRTARTIGKANPNPNMRKWAASVGTYLGRYKKRKGPPVHKSATCTVYFANDVTKAENDPNREVALKIMDVQSQFERERRVRQQGGNANAAFDAAHVVPLLTDHDQDDERGERQRCLVMPAAERSLEQAMSSERIAGVDLDKIMHFAKDIGGALEHLHERGVIHGDFKPRNIVRIHGDWKLIDFDAAVDIGSSIRKDEEGKKTSTAFCPPELAAVLFRPEKSVEDLEAELSVEDEKSMSKSATKQERLEALQRVIFLERQIEQLKAGSASDASTGIQAAPTFDVWSFGVVMFELCSGERLFNRGANDDEISGFGTSSTEDERQRLVNWEGLTTKQLAAVLPTSKQKERDAAIDLLVRCLRRLPEDRPQSMTAVLAHPFIDRPVDQTTTKLDDIERKLDQMKAEVKASCDRVMRGMLSLAETPIPSLWILVPKPLDDSLGFFARNAERLRGKVYDRYELRILCQLTGESVHDPIEIEFLNDSAIAVLKRAAPVIKISLLALKVGSVVGKAAGIPIPSDVPFLANHTDAASAINAMGKHFESFIETGSKVEAFIDEALDQDDVATAVAELNRSWEEMHQADARTCDQLRDVLKHGHDKKDWTLDDIRRASKLHRMEHREKGFIWVCDTDAAKERARELGFGDVHPAIEEAEAAREAAEEKAAAAETEANEARKETEAAQEKANAAKTEVEAAHNEIASLRAEITTPHAAATAAPLPAAAPPSPPVAASQGAPPPTAALAIHTGTLQKLPIAEEGGGCMFKGNRDKGWKERHFSLHLNDSRLSYWESDPETAASAKRQCHPKGVFAFDSTFEVLRVGEGKRDDSRSFVLSNEKFCSTHGGAARKIILRAASVDGCNEWMRKISRVTEASCDVPRDIRDEE